jgi:hypothetical protein
VARPLVVHPQGGRVGGRQPLERRGAIHGPTVRMPALAVCRIPYDTRRCRTKYGRRIAPIGRMLPT